MNFGEAIQAMKQGACVQREGWNGKGMHIYIEDSFGALVGRGGMRHEREYAPVIVMFTAQKTHQPGWLASQADMLADDWSALGGYEPKPAPRSASAETLERVRKCVDGWEDTRLKRALRAILDGAAK